MDICIGGILNGQKRKDNHNYFKVDSHYSEYGSEYSKEYFHLNGRIFSFWVSKEMNFIEAQKRVESYLVEV
ncbi:hypothetical protein ABLB96_08885 [Acinetobacter sp. XH1741]|uniref:hypothetical protein n=1 Tax=unclassified Acinetobacter TaxID=196816 RepID=UPI0032B60AE4